MNIKIHYKKFAWRVRLEMRKINVNQKLQLVLSDIKIGNINEQIIKQI